MEMSQLKNLSEALEPFLTATEESELPILLAILERTAAEYCRRWSEEASDPFEKAGLIACAETEVQIAEAIESLTSDLERRTHELKARFPELSATYVAVMEGLPRADQLRTQAEGEKGGATLLRQFAADAQAPESALFESLALREEANATFLWAVTSEGPL
jgi:cell division protein ZapA (FtsZ GTPase activity inhibitor)